MISIIMSVYNEEKEWLKAAIDSILNQTYKDFEFIITLDKPDNRELEEIIKSYSDSRIVFVKNSVNQGLVWSLNNMLKIAKGKYIARMDADDIALPHRLEKQLKAIEEKNVDFVGSSIIVFDNDKEYTDVINEYDYDIKKNIGCGGHIPHPTWFLKREVYESLGGYRNIYSAEDYDFILRAIKYGFKFYNCVEPLLKYRINVNGVSRKNAFKQRLTSIYLYDHSENINSVTSEKIEEYLKSKIGNEYKYQMGERLYFQYKEECNYIKKIKKIIALLFKYNVFLRYNNFRNTKLRVKMLFGGR